LAVSEAQPKPKKSPLWRLLPLIRQHGWAFWGGMFFICLGRVFEAFMPLFVRQGVNRMAGHDWHLLGPVLGILVLAVLRYATVAFGRQLVRLVGVTVTYDMRERLYWHFELQGPRFFARFPTGDLMARAINDLNLVRQLIGVGSRTLIVLGFSGIVAFGFMLFLSAKLTLWLLPVMPFIAVMGYVLSKRIYEQSTVVQEGFSSLSESVQENLNGIRTIQTHAQEDREVARFRSVSGAYADNYFRLMVLNAALNAWMVVFTGLAVVIIMGFGGWQVLHGEMSVGTFTAFTLYLGMAVAPIQQSGQIVSMFQRGSSGAARRSMRSAATSSCNISPTLIRGAPRPRTRAPATSSWVRPLYRTFRCMSGLARWSPFLAASVRASRPCCVRSYACSIRPPARSTSTAATSVSCRSRRCAARSRWSRKTPFSLPTNSAATFPTTIPNARRTRSGAPPRQPISKTRSSTFPTTCAPWLASAV
jgi:ABC-type multidrug transport system fused ATPase/permease subunit